MNPISQLTDAIIKKGLNEAQRTKFSEIIESKFELAIFTWAIAKMGKDRDKYIKLAWEDFLTNLALSGLFEVWDSGKFFPFVEEIPIIIPRNLNKKEIIPFAEHDPSQVQSEYNRILAELSKIKKKKWNNSAALLMSLKDKLPGLPEARLKKCVERKASDIALDYIAWKYKLSVGTESVKKRLALAKNPKKVFENMKKDLFKRAEVSLSIAR